MEGKTVIIGEQIIIHYQVFHMHICIDGYEWSERVSEWMITFAHICTFIVSKQSEMSFLLFHSVVRFNSL